MPTYEYTCRACGHIFEIVQKMSDDPLTMCPECGGELRKVFAPPAISFKGSGFYATDHGKKAKTRPSHDQKARSGEKNGREKEGRRSDGATQDGSKDTSAKGSLRRSGTTTTPAKKEPAPS